MNLEQPAGSERGLSLVKENPPDNGRVVLAGIAKPKSKSASGTEDFALTLRVEEL